jgi:hypothetical protein
MLQVTRSNSVPTAPSTTTQATAAAKTPGVSMSGAKRIKFETIDPESTLRVLVAPFKDLWVALPMTVTRKIIRLDEAQSQLKAGDRLAVDNFSAELFQLYEHIYDQPSPEPASHAVVLHLSPTQIVAIPMMQVPTIVNLPKADLMPIADDYRHLFMLEIASHITLLSQAEVDMTVFVLDTAKLADLLVDA